ncbi:TrkH family potassium uptake protein [Mycoplasma marinum]|uniref:TrkH family potassium uptake protein n=1 Tax=Mycoplasma marinum TaxID=1937190 RepID=UPI003B37C04F
MLFKNKNKNTKKTNSKNLSQKSYDGQWFKKLIYRIKSLSILKHILIFYLFITFIGSAVLMLPFSHKVPIKYIDALFTSASAFSDTGLVTMQTSTTWTIFGQATISILILFGGIGWFALKIFFFNILFGKPISLTSRTALSAERGNVRIGETRQLIKVSVIAIFTMMTIAGLILSIYFYFSNTFWVGGPGANMGMNPHGNWDLSIRYGVFHSISAINNAGFDIMGGHSIAPYFSDYFVQIIFIVLFVFGGIGYPVIYDVWQFFKYKREGKKFKFSLFTKISCITYFLISIIGIAITFGIETTAKSTVNNPSFWSSTELLFDGQGIGEGQVMTTSNKTMALIFNTLSTRNAGFGTINLHHFTSATLVVHSVMMFIGSAPSSTAGGIRTTTFAIVVIGFWAKIRGKSSARVFKRRLNRDTVWNAYVVTTISVFLVIVATLIATTSFNTHGGHIKFGANYDNQRTPSYDFIDLFFEVSSAFGTTGLSTGLTSQLNNATKILLVIIMFIGQLGVSSTIFAFGSKKQRSRHYKYVEEDVTIG